MERRQQRKSPARITFCSGWCDGGAASTSGLCGFGRSRDIRSSDGGRLDVPRGSWCEHGAVRQHDGQWASVLGAGVSNCSSCEQRYDKICIWESEDDARRSVWTKDVSEGRVLLPLSLPAPHAKCVPPRERSNMACSWEAKVQLRLI